MTSEGLGQGFRIRVTVRVRYKSLKCTDKTRPSQDKTRLGMTKQKVKTRQDKTRQTKQNKTKQDNIR